MSTYDHAVLPRATRPPLIGFIVVLALLLTTVWLAASPPTAADASGDSAPTRPIMITTNGITSTIEPPTSTASCT